MKELLRLYLCVSRVSISCWRLSSLDDLEEVAGHLSEQSLNNRALTDRALTEP
jgi:hypothetical protein